MDDFSNLWELLKKYTFFNDITGDLKSIKKKFFVR
jgi:hypothetical protein